ncbi:MAG: acyclic terpene utilization AtuA family protein [Actinomycetota bacterium]
MAAGPGPLKPRRPLVVANCSGFYGDRLSAAREMVEGGPIDVLTGDYLAELTMFLLWKARRREPAAGYATTFLRQLEEVLGTCLDRGVKVVTNAGGLDPAGLAREVRRLAGRLGLHPVVAHVEGDDLLARLPDLAGAGLPLAHLDTGMPLAEAGVVPVTAHAYLGAWGITAALAAGADVVVCGRVTDAALVAGPAAWHHGWRRDDWDALAGAVVAGHVLECGAQATGGNYAFLHELPDDRPPGFPLAEVAADGSSVITKHPGTGGLVTVGSVTAQLLYEIDAPAYVGPDVVAHVDTVRVTQVGPDRVRLHGVRGSPPPPTAKVALGYLGGYRNSVTFVCTGLDIEAKAARVARMLFDRLGGRDRFARAEVRLVRTDRVDAPTEELASAYLHVTVADPDPQRVGRAFSAAAVELALSSYPGCHTTGPPTRESAYGGFWPALVPAELVAPVVVLPDGRRVGVPGPPRTAPLPPPAPEPPPEPPPVPEPPEPMPAPEPEPTLRRPLGVALGARSGDKGGNANVGVWARGPVGYAWLRRWLTVDRFRALVPEAADRPVRRYDLPNLWACNFVVVGLLGEGAAATTRPDPQAKALGELLRSRYADLPAAVVAEATGGPGAGSPGR